MPEPISQRSELILPALGYGAANLGNLHRALSDDEAREVLEAAWDAGIRYYDTAPHYGIGTSERRLGAFLATKPREEYVVSTKAGRLLVPNEDYAGELDTAHDFYVPLWRPENGSRPPAQHIEALIGLGQIGYVKAIQLKLDEIGSEHPEHADFVAEMRALVDRFDLDQYLTTLKTLHAYEH